MSNRPRRLLLATLVVCAVALVAPNTSRAVDGDGDGYDSPTDCDDTNAAIYPGATETPGDGIDQNCDNKELCFIDADHDHYGTPGLVLSDAGDLACSHTGVAPNNADCDDSNPAIHPNATEVVADSIDQNCDGHEVCYADDDHDGFGSPALRDSLDTDCVPNSPAEGISANVLDCDDANAARNPGASEVCDAAAVDEDCDGLADDSDPQGASGKTLSFRDMDGDGYGSGALGLFCHGSTVNSDCNDSDASTYPSAPEIPGDNIDEDCDGREDCYADADNDGFPTNTLVVSLDADCNDVGEGTAAELQSAPDCDDAHATAHPGGQEVCDPDGVDEDCDGLVNNADPDAVKATFYEDVDDDGFGNPFLPLQLCDPVPGTTSDHTDCDDSDAAINPDATEIPGNVFDENCDGVILCYVDYDGDGYRPDLTSTIQSNDLDCTDDGEAKATDPAGDCDDSDATIHPNAVEVCGDAADNDCDGLADCLDPTCAGDATCPSGPSPCSGGPFSCKNPGVTKLDVRNVTPDDGDKLVFRWTLGDETSAAELGDPTVDTNYAVCVWDEVAGSPVLVMEMQAPPAGNCLGRPCWRAAGDGFRYRDPGHLPSGVDRMKVQAGPLGKSSIKVTGRGAELPDPPMPFQQDPHIIVQVVNSLGNCWGADYMSPAQSNTDTRLEVTEKP